MAGLRRRHRSAGKGLDAGTVVAGDYQKIGNPGAVGGDDSRFDQGGRPRSGRKGLQSPLSAIRPPLPAARIRHFIPMIMNQTDPPSLMRHERAGTRIHSLTTAFLDP